MLIYMPTQLQNLGSVVNTLLDTAQQELEQHTPESAKRAEAKVMQAYDTLTKVSGICKIEPAWLLAVEAYKARIPDIDVALAEFDLSLSGEYYHP